MAHSTEIESFPSVSRAVARILLFCQAGVFLCLTGCGTTSKSTTDRKFEKRYAGFQYSKVEAVRQSEQKSCGAAALTSVLNYWKEDPAPSFVEKELIRKYPSRSEDGYPILQLREIAMKERFAAFAVTLEANPWKQLGEQLDNGRPVICAVRLPRGRYFGLAAPLIDSYDINLLPLPDSSLIRADNDWKSHYVVAMGRSYNEILLMDPKYGIVRLDKDRFLHYWRLEKHAALICSSIQPLEES